MVIEIEKMYEDVTFPVYATAGAAGCDMVAHNFQWFNNGGPNKRIIKKSEFAKLPAQEDKNMYLIIDDNTHSVTIPPGSRLYVGFGFKVAIPQDYEMQIRPRSGLALKEGLEVLNAPGTIDSDYRGEVGVLLYNSSRDNITIKLGTRVAQGVIAPVEQAEWSVTTKLSETARGLGGFGSTGLQKLNDPLADNGYVKTGSHTS